MLLKEKKRIKLLAVDIDGCITPGEGQPASLETLARLKQINELAGRDPDVPAVTLCTGRQQPFVDLMCQMIGCRKPAIFESGSGLYMPETYEFLFHPSITDEKIESLREYERVVRAEMVRGGTSKLQPGKEVSLSVYPRAGYSVEDNAAQLRELLKRTGADLVLDVSRLCVNVLFPGIDKGEGVRWVGRVLGLARGEMGAVGDAPGDICSFEAAGFGAAPANAAPEVIAAADFTAPRENGLGVLDIVDEVIKRNRE